MAGEYRKGPGRGRTGRGRKAAVAKPGPAKTGDGKVGRRTRHRGKLPYTTHAGDGVVVNGYSERWLRQGFPWVYQDEVVARTGSLVPGRVVGIRARDGSVLGTGIWDSGKIEVRRFRRDEGPVDADFLRTAVAAAKDRRPLPPQTDAWRWVHGENDDLPGVRVDVWGDQLTLTLDSPALHGLLGPLLDALTTLHETNAVWLCWRPAIEQAPAEPLPVADGSLVWGDARREPVMVQERGVSFRVRPWAGADAGLYVDMREVRRWLEPYWVARRVLNLFAYTGAFSVAAALGGATEVVSVDLAGPHLARLRDNLDANGVSTDQHPLREADVFKALDHLRRRGESFDVVIADPPSFSHGPSGAWSVERDYGRLIAACLRVLSPGGWLVAACNHGGVSPKEFQKHVAKGATKAGRSLRLVHVGSPPVDVPAALDFPESRYLKVWVLVA